MSDADNAELKNATSSIKPWWYRLYIELEPILKLAASDVLKLEADPLASREPLTYNLSLPDSCVAAT